MNFLRKFFFPILLLFLLILFSSTVYSQELTPTPEVTSTPTPTQTQSNNSPDQNKLNDLQKEINDLQNKIADVQTQEKTLSSQISVMDNQIKLTELRINATKQKLVIIEEDIEKATKKISQLETSLTDITKVLLNRITATYEVGSIKSINLLLSSNNISDFFKRANYLKIVQAHDKMLLFETQQAKTDYANQKVIFEEKKKSVVTLKKQLENYTMQLDQEKKNKKALLDVTQNNEKKYQDMLARARAEFEAIQGIAAGKGTETEVADVKEGETIATVISGLSACSTGTHLHFEVHDNGSIVNPVSYLSPKDVDWDLCGWFGCDSSFGFSGSWSWPLNEKPTVTQGYGMTAYARSGAYGGGPHTGIDMLSDDLAVKAVKDGKLYRGSIACGGGRLRYVKVDHQDSNVDSLYLHVNYVL